MLTLPVGLVLTTLIDRVRASRGNRSAVGFSHQSCSPDCRAPTLVAGSGMVVHSTRSKWTIFGPAVQSGVPPCRGTYLSNFW